MQLGGEADDETREVPELVVRCALGKASYPPRRMDRGQHSLKLSRTPERSLQAARLERAFLEGKEERRIHSWGRMAQCGGLSATREGSLPRVREP